MEKDLLDAAERLIQTVGFPIAVACWFMFRLEKRLDAHAAALNRLAVLLARLGGETGEQPEE